MAAVFLAEDQRLARRVAVKRLHADSPEDMARRFEREARVGASLNHPNIVSVYDVIADEAGVIIVMEYVEGESLRDALGRGPLPTARALEIVSAIATALDHAHARRVVHRDVKPANVLLGRQGGVKLADLGIATAAGATQVTTSGVVLGTPSYMAPEQLEGQGVGPAADTYALAAVAFEALSGRRARSGKTPLELARRARDEPPPDLRAAWPDAPAEAAEELKRGLCRDPAGRQSTAGELARGLSTALQSDKEGVDATERTLLMPLLPRGERRARPGTPGAAPFRHSRVSRSTNAPAPASGQLRARIAILAGVGLLALLAVLVLVLSLSRSESPSAGGQQQAELERPAGGALEREGSEAEEPPTNVEPAPPDAGATGAPETVEGGAPAPSGENDPALGAVLNDQGKALIDQGRPEEAVPVLQRAVAAFPPGTDDVNYAYALFNLGNALRLANRPAEAIPVLERRLQIPNQRPAVRRELSFATAAAE